MSDVNALIIGAGPAGLSAAIRLKQKLNQAGRKESVVVVEKAQSLGYHSLSGAIFEPECVEELFPGWREQPESFFKQMIPIEKDEMFFLRPKAAFHVPDYAVPSGMRHKGDYAISLSRFVDWLGKEAQKIGVEIYTGFSAEKVLIDKGAVQGVKLVDLGLSKEGKPKSNFLSGELIKADVTLFADGSMGVLSRQLARAFGKGVNPQIYSVGIKELIKLPKDNIFGPHRAVHTLGFPSRSDVFGGGFMYSMGDNTVAVGLILGLDWPVSNLDPQLEMEVYKSHRFVAKLLQGGQVVASGAKTIPEGGYFSIPKLFMKGGLVLGDAAGFVNMEKIKGIHYAIRSGVSAADAVFDAIDTKDFSKEKLEQYVKNLDKRNVLAEMYAARNFRQCFKLGLYMGAPLSLIQRLIPFNLRVGKDYLSMKSKLRMKRNPNVGLSKAAFVGLSGTAHREDEPSHIRILEPKLCVECSKTFGNPCIQFCPGQVYRMKEDQLILSPSNCLHDQSCVVKCPYQNVKWTPPEGGEGPRFKHM